jgi:hypothetical protein
MEVPVMRLRTRIEVISKLRVGPAVIVLLAFYSLTAVAQSTNPGRASSILPISTTTDRVGNELVFESYTITIRHITIKPNAVGYPYRHSGGSIILLHEYAFTIHIPLGEVLDGELKAGDVIPVAAGDYLLENPTTKPLEFLSIEKKQN